jgi:hypothetical protein
VTTLPNVNRPNAREAAISPDPTASLKTPVMRAHPNSAPPRAGLLFVRCGYTKVQLGLGCMRVNADRALEPPRSQELFSNNYIAKLTSETHLGHRQWSLAIVQTRHNPL